MISVKPIERQPNQRLNSLQPFRHQFSLKSIFQCCKNRGSSYDRLYRQGLKSVQSHLEIEYIVKSLRRLEDLSKIILSKRQRHMLPYLKSNVLTLTSDQSKSINMESPNDYIEQLVEKSKRRETGDSKTDVFQRHIEQRLIK